MDVGPGADGLDAALEAAVVSAVRGVDDLQVVDATVGSEVEPGWKQKRISQLDTCFFRFYKPDVVLVLTIRRLG